MDVLAYIAKAATTWFIGFFPAFEIYVAVPAGLAMGLDPVSATVWSILGNFSVVPLMIFLHDRLMRIDRLRRWVEKRSTETWQARADRYGPWFVLIFTPILGVWITTVVAQAAGVRRGPLMTYAFISISIFAVAIVVAIQLGLDWVTG